MKVKKRFPVIHHYIVQLKKYSSPISQEERYYLFNIGREMNNMENDWKAMTEKYNVSKNELEAIIQLNLNNEEGQAIHKNIIGIEKNQWIERDRQPNKLLAEASLAFDSKIDPELARELTQFEKEREQLKALKQGLVAHDAQERFNIEELKQALNIEIEKQYNNDDPKNSSQNVTMAYKKLSFRIKHITDEALPITTKAHIWKEYFDECAKELSSVDPEKSAQMIEDAKTLEGWALKANKCESYDSILGTYTSLNPTRLGELPETFYIPEEIESLALAEQNRLGLKCIYDEIVRRNFRLKQNDGTIRDHLLNVVNLESDVFTDPDISASDIKSLIMMKAAKSLEELEKTDDKNWKKRIFLKQILELEETNLFGEGMRQDLFTYYRYGLLKHGILTEEDHYYPAKVLAILDTRKQLKENLDKLEDQLHDFEYELPLYFADGFKKDGCGGCENLREIIEIVDQVVGGEEKTDKMATLLLVLRRLLQTTEENWRTAHRKIFNHINKKEEKRSRSRVKIQELLPKEERDKIIDLRGKRMCLIEYSKLVKNLDEEDVAGQGLFGNYNYREKVKRLFLAFEKHARLYLQQKKINTVAVNKRYAQLENEEQAGAAPARGRR